MSRSIINTDKAPAAIGTYSQAVKVGNTIYISGQIPLDPATGAMVEGPIETHIHRCFDNLKAIAEAAGASLNDAVKINVSILDLDNFAALNAIMSEYIKQPYPARAAVGVASLPKGSLVEIEAILVVDN